MNDHMENILATPHSDYKRSFIKKTAVDDYLKLYSNESNYASLLYGIEKDILTSIIRRLKKKGMGERYLDFAVGTGRIITHLEGYFIESEGIDISHEMVKVARDRSNSSNIVCADITQEPLSSRNYDLVTAFRFFLNAEPELRESIMSPISQSLRDNNSVLIINNHGRVPSIKSIKRLYHKIRFYFLGKQKNENFLSDSELKNLLLRHGLSIESEYGYGILGVKTSKLIGLRASKIIESIFAGSYVAKLIGGSKIYVIRNSSKV